MFEQDLYVREKLRALERQRRQPLPPPAAPPRRRILAPLARRAGHRIRHLGEALESWAAAPPRATG